MPVSRGDDKASNEWVLQQQRLAVAFYVKTVVSAAFIYCTMYFSKEPYNASSLSGELWLQELLDGHPEWFQTQFGINKHVFQHLVHDLQNIGLTCLKYLTLKEHVVIFLYTLVTALSSWLVAEQFQHSLDTITRYMEFFCSQASFNMNYGDTIRKYFLPCH
jgi:hypothetical protein